MKAKKPVDWTADNLAGIKADAKLMRAAVQQFCKRNSTRATVAEYRAAIAAELHKLAAEMAANAKMLEDMR